MALVTDIMTSDVVTVKSSETVFDAALRMAEHDMGCLVVTKNGEPGGTITQNDIVSKVICKRKDPSRVLVGEAMSSPLVAVHPLMELEELADTFNKTGLKRLGVVSSGQLEGIVSTEDLIAAETRLIKVLERYIELLKSGK